MRIVAANANGFVSTHLENIGGSHDALALHGRTTFPKSVSYSRNDSKNST